MNNESISLRLVLGELAGGFFRKLLIQTSHMDFPAAPLSIPGESRRQAGVAGKSIWEVLVTKNMCCEQKKSKNDKKCQRNKI